MSATLQFKPAVRAESFARIALYGISGSGKTYTALSLANTFTPGSVAVVDTERGRARMYDGVNGWKFNYVAPQSFSPDSLVELLGIAAGSGHKTVIVDSLSHYWMGQGGMLEQVDRATKNGNTFSSGWKEMRSPERRMLDAILSYPGNVIVTLRTKAEYVISENERGKKEPRKIGLKPEQREGIEYEFDVVGSLDREHNLDVVKSVVMALPQGEYPTPGPEIAVTIRDWMEQGSPELGAFDYRQKILDAGTVDDLKALWDSVTAEGLRHAPITDQMGSPTTLGELIGEQKKALEATPPAPAAAPAVAPEQPQQTAAAPVKTTPVKAAGDREPVAVGEVMGEMAKNMPAPAPEAPAQQDRGVSALNEMSRDEAAESVQESLESIQDTINDEGGMDLVPTEQLREMWAELKANGKWAKDNLGPEAVITSDARAVWTAVDAALKSRGLKVA
jgi:hypothetical protein